MNKLNSGTRLATMLLDHVAMIIVIMIVAAPAMAYDMIQIFGDQDAPPKLFLGNYYINIFAFSLYFNKDIYLGRSIAKRILKLQIVDVKTNKPANSLRCLVRNVTIAFWPIEVIFALINNERRIGDYMAGTKLTTFDPGQHQAQVNWLLIIIALVVSMLVAYLIMFFPMELLYDGGDVSVH
jgi:uncharacterized RDD family membrane protein YckC